MFKPFPAFTLTLALFFWGAYNCSAQQTATSNTNILGQSLAHEVNVVTTAVPFLEISPDARAGGMGDCGVATAPDANSMAWNPAKYAFIQDDMGFSVSYTPWLRQLVPDISLSYLSMYKRIKKNQVIAFALRYFDMGNIQFTDNNGVEIGNFNPNEYSLDAAYSLKLNEQWSVGMAARYIYSNLTGAISVPGAGYTHAGQGLGVDLSVYHQTQKVVIAGKDCFWAFGAVIQNIGPKISYTQTGYADYIPINLRVGPSLTMNFDPYNKITFDLDINKLLVPTPPYYLQSKTGGDSLNKEGQEIIEYGMNPNVPVPEGMVESFYDAPGGALEEFHEIDWCGGFEYWYDNQFAARCGFFYENIDAGGRQYVTLGTGFRLKVMSVDVSYLIPFTQQNPLQNTLRLTIGFNLDKNKKPDKTSDDNTPDDTQQQ